MSKLVNRDQKCYGCAAVIPESVQISCVTCREYNLERKFCSQDCFKSYGISCCRVYQDENLKFKTAPLHDLEHDNIVNEKSKDGVVSIPWVRLKLFTVYLYRVDKQYTASPGRQILSSRSSVCHWKRQARWKLFYYRTSSIWLGLKVLRSLRRTDFGRISRIKHEPEVNRYQVTVLLLSFYFQKLIRSKRCTTELYLNYTNVCLWVTIWCPYPTRIVLIVHPIQAILLTTSQEYNANVEDFTLSL